MPYVRSLDGLRAIAILLVMGVHYHLKLPGGWVGVQLFFVLSGFLITRILSATPAGADRAGSYGNFLRRRARRIVPLCLAYCLLLAGASLHPDAPPAWRVALPWLLTFTLNIGHALDRVPIDDMYSHFWSLGVEMQAYLLWPLVIGALSKAALRRAILAALVVAPLCRWSLVAAGCQPSDLYFLLPCQLDGFAAGAAVAVFEPELQGLDAGKLSALLRGRRNLRALAAALSLAVGLGVAVNWAADPALALKTGGYPYYMPRSLQYVWGYSLIDLTSALAILACVRGQLTLLESPWLVMTGRISYGLYVFHRPLVGLLDRWAAPLVRASAGRPVAAALLALTYLGGSYGLALSSYYWFESRFLPRRAPPVGPGLALGPRLDAGR